MQCWSSGPRGTLNSKDLAPIALRHAQLWSRAEDPPHCWMAVWGIFFLCPKETYFWLSYCRVKEVIPETLKYTGSWWNRSWKSPGCAVWTSDFVSWLHHSPVGFGWVIALLWVSVSLEGKTVITWPPSQCGSILPMSETCGIALWTAKTHVRGRSPCSAHPDSWPCGPVLVML